MPGSSFPPSWLRRHAIGRVVAARPRYATAFSVGGAAALLPAAVTASQRFLLAFDVGAATWLVLVGVMVARSGRDDLQRRADEDAGAFALLALGSAACFASVVAIAAELHGLKDASGGTAGLRIAVVIVTILLSWFFLHASFALHYAHDFYAGAEDRRGLDFPGEPDPDYWDFAYFAFNLGAAAQTSDVAIRSRRTRRFVLAHTIIAFLFNTTILALAINVGASLL